MFMAPENGWLEYGRFLLGWPIFRGKPLVLGSVIVSPTGRFCSLNSLQPALAEKKNVLENPGFGSVFEDVLF